MICRANGTSRSAVTWDATARRAQDTPGTVTRPAGPAWTAGAAAGLQAAGIAGARWYPAAGHAGRGMAAGQTEMGPAPAWIG
jgi:hypothetical protein